MSLFHHFAPFLPFLNDRIQSLGLFLEFRRTMRLETHRIIRKQFLLCCFEVTFTAEFDKTVGNCLLYTSRCV